MDDKRMVKIELGTGHSGPCGGRVQHEDVFSIWIDGIELSYEFLKGLVNEDGSRYLVFTRAGNTVKIDSYDMRAFGVAKHA